MNIDADILFAAGLVFFAMGLGLLFFDLPGGWVAMIFAAMLLVLS